MYMSFSKQYKGIADVFMRDPKHYAPLLEFIKQVMERPSELTVPEREMIAAHVSELNGCGFCVGAHLATLRAMGEPEGVISELTKIPVSRRLPKKLTKLLEFAAKLTKDPEAITEQEVQGLVAEGYSEQTVEDLANVVATFSLVNRLADTFGVTGNPDYFDVIGNMLARDGYQPFINMVAAKA